MGSDETLILRSSEIDDERRTLPKTNLSSLYRSAWSGYDSPFVKNVIDGAMKALTLLSALTFDVGLMYWTKGLEKHLKDKIKETEKAKKEINKYKF